MRIKTELNFPGELKDEPVICQLCKQFDIVLSIIEASFSTEIGWAVLILEGSNEEVKKAFAFLKNRGVEIKNLQEIS